LRRWQALDRQTSEWDELRNLLSLFPRGLALSSLASVRSMAHVPRSIWSRC
jgi:hypothetical protein